MSIEETLECCQDRTPRQKRTGVQENNLRMWWARGIILWITATAAFCTAAHVNSWLTTADPVTGSVHKLLEPQQPIPVGSDAIDTVAADFTIDISSTKQKIVGYGAGLPQSSASVLYDLKKRDVALYTSVMDQLFSLRNDGAGINILRFPIGSCDFSIHNTSYDEHKDDYELKYFAIDDDSRMIVEVLKDALKINPGLVIIASPWSAPSWLKVMGTLIAYNEKNTLLPTEQAYSAYARYFARVLQAYRAEGLAIQYFTLQNEPLFGNSDQYPGMYFSNEQAVKLGNLVHSLLGSEVKLLAYDHNWDVPSYPLDVLITMRDRSTFVGTAWHCYGGEMAPAMDQLHEAFPAYEQHVTECTGAYPDGVCDITKGMVDFGWNHEWDMSNILLGAAAHWSSSGVKWILALDEHCGPTLPDVTFTSGRPLVSIASNATSFADIYFNQDFHSIKHMSRFLTSGAVMASSAGAAVKGEGAAGTGTVRVTTTASTQIDSLILESFYHAATKTVTVIALNKDHENDVIVRLTQGSTTFVDSVPKFGTKVYQWTEA